MAHSAKRSQSNRNDEDDLVDLIKSLNRRVATLGARVVEKLFPPMTARLQQNRHALLDPPTFGAQENYSFSSMQINISPLTEHNLSSLGYSGDSHIDRHDDPLSLSLLMCVSHLNSDTDPGNFYIGETREWCKLRPFSLLIFRGTGPHGGTQAIPKRIESGEAEKRINLILYPRREFVNRTEGILYPCSAERVADYSFFDDGAACFGSDAYHKAWCSRELFRHMIMANERYGVRVKDSDLQRAFAAFTGSPKPYIDPESPEGQTILESIKVANDILISVRPRWVAQKNPPPEEAQDRTSQISPQPAGIHEQFAGRQTQASIAPGNQVAVPVHPAPNRRCSTRILEAAAELSPTSAKVTSVSGPPSRPKTKGRTSPREATNVERGSDDCDDVESIHEMDEDSEVLPTVSDDKPPLIEMLQCQPLFQLEVMEGEVDAIESRATLLAYKFNKRTPQLSEQVLPQPASLPLPTTDGPTIVEKLIQLAELCHWVTQKSQHLWFYRRALDESFFLNLLQVEVLFDLTELTSIFKNDVRQTGAGFCSRALMDEVETMVDRMVIKARNGDNTEERITFDPKTILGEQYQQKFCATVETRLRPYHGKDQYLHMAQHFREVCIHLCFKTDSEIVFRMLFGGSLRRYLQLDECTGKTYVYDRGEGARTTIALRRFLHKLKISRILFRIFGIWSDSSMLTNGELGRILSNTASCAIPAVCT